MTSNQSSLKQSVVRSICTQDEPQLQGEWLQASAADAERRRRSRMTLIAPAIVRCTGTDGRTFEENAATARLENLSASGALLRLSKPLEPGQTLFFIFAFPKQAENAGASSSARIAVRAVVRRSEALGDEGYGIGVEVLHHRFVYGSQAAASASH